MSSTTITKTVASFKTPPRLPKAEKAHLDTLTDDTITAARDDADNPVLTREDLEGCPRAMTESG